MADITPGSDLTPKPSDSGDQNGKGFPDLSGRDQRQSSRSHRHSNRHHHQREQKSLESHGRSGYRRSENLLARRFLPIVGIIFILVAGYLSITSMEFFGFFRQIISDATSVIIDFFHSSGTKVHRQVILVNTGPSGAMIGTIIFFMLTIPSLIYLSVRVQKIGIQTFALIVWILFALYWILREIMDFNLFLFYAYIIGGFLIHMAFYLANLNGNYLKRRVWIRRLEFLLIIANSGFYFISVFFILWWSGYNFMYLPLTLSMALFNLSAMFIVSKRQSGFNRIAYLFYIAFLLSCIPSLVFSMNYAVLFLTTFAVLLMILSKFTGDQSSVVISLLALTLAIFYHLTQWILGYIPAVFTEPLPLDITIFYKAVLASAFMLGSLVFLNSTTKTLHISISKKWFHRSNTRKILKGLILLFIYLSLFLIYDFLLSNLFANDEARILIWFSFNCLYFLIIIPVLSGQNSSFLPKILAVGIISLIIYPTIVHLDILKIRSNYLESGSIWFPEFLFHYLILALVIVLLFLIYYYVRRVYSFKKVLIKTYWVYFTVMAFFLILSEFDHLMVIIGDRQRSGVIETISWTHKLPYSLFLLCASLFILILGFIKKARFLRVFSLVILIMTIVKLLLFDMMSFTIGEKTVLLLILGTLFLIISYFYNAVKHIFIPKTHGHGHSSKAENPPDEPGLK
ncbi:MAG: DUF2339 domain-containing protein [Bacteroidetes bacterium]|nr:DUF2339 domain-containing protein [Bacteroidota bacterium]